MNIKSVLMQTLLNNLHMNYIKRWRYRYLRRYIPVHLFLVLCKTLSQPAWSMWVFNITLFGPASLIVFAYHHMYVKFVVYTEYCSWSSISQEFLFTILSITQQDPTFAQLFEKNLLSKLLSYLIAFHNHNLA